MATPINLTTTAFPARARAITPHDTNKLVDHSGSEQAQHVYATVAGNVVVQPAGNPAGSTVTFAVLDAGFVPVMCSAVLSTGTTATGLIGLF